MQPDFLGMGNYGNPVPTVGNLGGLSNLDTGVNFSASPLPPGIASPTATAGNPGFFSMDSFLGENGQNGWGGLALNTFTGLANTFLGMQQYGLAKDSLRENKRQFNLNFDAQRKLTNSRLEDRQRARVASNPGAYQSVGAYMEQNGI